MEPLEIRESDNRVFVWARFLGHGAGSGVAIDMERAQVWTMEAAKIRRVEEHFDRASKLSKPWGCRSSSAPRRAVPRSVRMRTTPHMGGGTALGMETVDVARAPS